MNKVLLIIFFFFFLSQAHSQEISGNAYYSVIKSTDSVNNAADELWMLSAYPFVPKIASMMEFKLEFTAINSLFTRVKSKELEKLAKEDVETTEMLIGYRDSTWQDTAYCYNFDRDMEKNPMDRKGLIVKTRNNFSWKIGTETKVIGEFTCYKATGNREIEFRKDGKQQMRTTPVIAWFCPEIPVPFGPIFARDLPGLIFEFQFGGTVYGLKKLDLLNKTEIAPLPNKEIITKKEWRERLHKKAKELNIQYQ